MWAILVGLVLLLSSPWGTLWVRIDKLPSISWLSFGSLLLFFLVLLSCHKFVLVSSEGKP
jgi:hypothetical protein